MPSQTKLFVSSEVPIYKIFSDDPNANNNKGISDHMRSVMDDLVRLPAVTVETEAQTGYAY